MNPISVTDSLTVMMGVMSRVALKLPRISVIQTDSSGVVRLEYVFRKPGTVTVLQIVTMVQTNLQHVEM